MPTDNFDPLAPWRMPQPTPAQEEATAPITREQARALFLSTANALQGYVTNPDYKRHWEYFAENAFLRWWAEQEGTPEQRAATDPGMEQRVRDANTWIRMLGHSLGTSSTSIARLNDYFPDLHFKVRDRGGVVTMDEELVCDARGKAEGTENVG